MPRYSFLAFILLGVLWSSCIWIWYLTLIWGKLSLISVLNISSIPFFLLYYIHVILFVVVPKSLSILLFFFSVSLFFLILKVFIEISSSSEILSSAIFSSLINQLKAIFTSVTVFLPFLLFLFFFPLEFSSLCLSWLSDLPCCWLYLLKPCIGGPVAGVLRICRLWPAEWGGTNHPHGVGR